MTKISIDVDFDKDPEAILKEIQEKAKTEVERREKKERAVAHLERLHEKVNNSVGTSYSNANDLIRALAAFATPALRDRILGVTSSGRRKTMTMTKEFFDQIKTSLAKDGVTKAQIARETGASSSQVTKVEHGGYDAKFGGEGAIAPLVSSDSSEEAVESPVSEEEPDGAHDQAELSIPELEPKQEEMPILEPSLAPLPPESPQMAVVDAPESEEIAEPEAKLEPFDQEDGAVPNLSEETAPEQIESFQAPPPDSPVPTIPAPAFPPSPEFGIPEPDGEPPTEPGLSPPVGEEIAEPLDSGEMTPSGLDAPMPPPPSGPVAETEGPPSVEPPPASDQGGADPGAVPPITPEPIEKPKPTINISSKKKSKIPLKGKFSSYVTRPPISRPGDKG